MADTCYTARNAPPSAQREDERPPAPSPAAPGLAGHRRQHPWVLAKVPCPAALSAPAPAHTSAPAAQLLPCLTPG